MLARQDWMSDGVYELYVGEELARKNTLEAQQSGRTGALIAIKAQHPLTAEGEPGAEYTARLKKALEVREQLQVRGMGVHLMTFGGVHEGCDHETLARAGWCWLVAHGCDVGEVLMRPKVFGGNDEDRLAVEQFRAEPIYAELHVVLSLGQIHRSVAYYNHLGLQPTFHPVTFVAQRPHHSSTCEMFGPWGLPAFAQGPEELARRTAEIARKHQEDAK